MLGLLGSNIGKELGSLQMFEMLVRGGRLLILPSPRLLHAPLFDTDELACGVLVMLHFN